MNIWNQYNFFKNKASSKKLRKYALYLEKKRKMKNSQKRRSYSNRDTVALSRKTQKYAYIHNNWKLTQTKKRGRYGLN